MSYIDILMNPDRVAYQEVLTESLAGLTDLPVVYIDGERKLAGALTAELLISELKTLDVSRDGEDS